MIGGQREERARWRTNVFPLNAKRCLAVAKGAGYTARLQSVRIDSTFLLLNQGREERRVNIF